MTIGMDAALSALKAFGKKLDVTSNNIANVNTDGFKKTRAVLEDANPGVRVTLSRVNTPGDLIPVVAGSAGPKESSNVDLPEEIVDLAISKNGFQANLKTIQAEEEMLGSLFDILV